MTLTEAISSSFKEWTPSIRKVPTDEVVAVEATASVAQAVLATIESPATKFVITPLEEKGVFRYTPTDTFSSSNNRPRPDICTFALAGFEMCGGGRK